MGEAIVLTPVGRIVWGHPTRMTQNTDDDGKPVFNDDGTPSLSATFGLAIPKSEFAPVWAAMQTAAQGVPGAGTNEFAWKYKDGDTAVDKQGKPFRDMPGRAGCIILTISTQIKEMTVVSKHIGGGQFQTLGENEVKTGDFIRSSLKIVGHGPNPKKRGSKSGLYINPQGHEFIGYGEAISSGPNAAALFGNAPAVQLPPGASATPIAGSSQLPPGMGVPSSPPGMGVPSSPPGAPVGMPGNASAMPGNASAMPGPGFAPAAVPAMPQASPVGMPGPVPTAFPSNPPAMPGTPAPYPQFVQNAMPQPAPAPAPAPMPGVPSSPQPGAMGQQPVAFDPASGRPIYGYTPHNGQNFPIFGYNPDGSPIYQ